MHTIPNISFPENLFLSSTVTQTATETSQTTIIVTTTSTVTSPTTTTATVTQTQTVTETSTVIVTATSTSTNIGATVKVEPNQINVKSNGQTITAYIELPSGYDVNKIKISTVTLGSVPAQPSPSSIGDYDGDGVTDLMVKFDRAQVASTLGVGSHTVAISGILTTGDTFTGTTTITVK